MQMHMHASTVLSETEAFQPHRCPIRRTLEVVALAVVTGTIWLGISYGSPCCPLPPPALQAALQPQPLPQTITILLDYDSFPRLWCPAGYYSAFGQARALGPYSCQYRHGGDLASKRAFQCAYVEHPETFTSLSQAPSMPLAPWRTGPFMCAYLHACASASSAGVHTSRI